MERVISVYVDRLGKQVRLYWDKPHVMFKIDGKEYHKDLYTESPEFVVTNILEEINNILDAEMIEEDTYIWFKVNKYKGRE